MKEKNYSYIIRPILISFISFSFLISFFQQYSLAQEIPEDKMKVFSTSGFPIPRFLSLAKEVTNVRAGPGQQYPVKWVVKKKRLPVEVILEFDHWRKIKDYEGEQGWIYKTLLSGKRTALVKGKKAVPAYDLNPSENPKKTSVLMMLEPLSLVDVHECNGVFCYISVSSLSGWMEIKSLWGVYETEKFD